MATITGPLISLRARGTIGKTATYSSWRGVGYVRTRVVPANPRTTAQQNNRGTFSYLQATWKIMESPLQAIWTLAAKGNPFTDRNLFTKTNVLNMGALPILTHDMDLSAGVNAGLPLASVTVTPGANQLALTCTTPTPPTGWTYTGTIWAINNLTVDDAANFATLLEAENDVSPYAHTFTGLVTADHYNVWGIAKWLKPDGSIAYGKNVKSTGIPT